MDNVPGSTGCQPSSTSTGQRLRTLWSTGQRLRTLCMWHGWSKRYRRVEGLWAEGLIGFDRTIAMLRLAVAGADAEVVEESRRMDLAGVDRLAARLRCITRGFEHAVFVDRFVSIQPTLDEASWHLSGRLAAVDGKIVEQALHARADQLRVLPGGETCTRAQRQADSLVAMAHDSLDRQDRIETTAGSAVSTLIDLDQADGTGGELGAAVEYGPRVGPTALEELLCTGAVQIIGVAHSRPVVTSTASRVIPPAIRRFVAHRDGGCVIAGCMSRYRLQPRHIMHRTDGGSHDPETSPRSAGSTTTSQSTTTASPSTPTRHR